MLRRASAIGIAFLPLLALSESARGGDNADAITGGAVAATVLAVACATTALTQPDEEGYGRRGLLVGLAGSYAIDNFEGGSVVSSTHESLGINGRVGYRCHSRFSAEVEVEWLDGFEADGVPADLDLEPLVVTANAKGYLLTGRYQPFLLVGPGVVKATEEVRPSLSDREIQFALRFGAGLDFYATENIVLSVGADYLLPFGDLKDFDYISIGWGLQYRF